MLFQQGQVLLELEIVLLADVVRLVAGDRVDAGLGNARDVSRVLEGLTQAVNGQPPVDAEGFIDLPVQPRADRSAPALR